MSTTLKTSLLSPESLRMDKELPVMEHFYTIQGEGTNSGEAAYFIRLAGCDVGCHWCDVKESWSSSSDQLIGIDQLVEIVLQSGATNVVITGGEPLMYNLDFLTAALQKKGLKTCIETSGAYPLSGSWDWICISPKKFKPPESAIFNVAHELKVVIFNKTDFEWAEKHAEKVSSSCNLYLQPEWGKQKEVLPLIIAYVKENPKWRISLQIHNIMEIP